MYHYIVKMSFNKKRCLSVKTPFYNIKVFNKIERKIKGEMYKKYTRKFYKVLLLGTGQRYISINKL